MRFLKVLALIVFASFLVIGCGSGGGGDSDTGDSSKTATGQITGGGPESGTIDVRFDTTNFECGPDELGTETFTVSYLDDTTMIWPDAEATWKRSSGDPDDIRGAWRLVEDGVSLTFTIANDYSFSIKGTIDCDEDDD